VAGYIAREQSPSKDGWQPAGAILVSGLYDTPSMERNPLFNAYFSDPGVEEEKPFLNALVRTQVPLMSVIAELDPVDFIRQFNKLNEAYLQQHQRLPHIVQMNGHNHLSTVMHINTEDQSLSAPLLEFMRST
jgi:triacylglycerol lipase